MRLPAVCAEVVKWLETAASKSFPCYPMFESERNLDNLRQDPHFIAFMANLNSSGSPGAMWEIDLNSNWRRTITLWSLMFLLLRILLPRL